MMVRVMLALSPSYSGDEILSHVPDTELLCMMSSLLHGTT